MATCDVKAPNAEQPQGEPGGEESGATAGASAAMALELPSYVEDLPDDVLLLILGRLDIKTRVIVERVCHRWKELSKRLWRAQCKLSFTNTFSDGLGKPLTVKILRAILIRCGDSLRELRLAMPTQKLGHRAVKAIASRCPNLEYLDASGVQLSNTSVLGLANKCPKLKYIRLKDCSNVKEKSLRRLLQRCKSLEHFDVAGMYHFTGECFNVQGLRLRRLVLRDLSGLTVRGTSRIATKCSSLTELVLHNCYTIADHELESLCQNMKALKTLELARSLYHASSNGISAIGTLHHLETLDLSSNGSVDDAAMASICLGCTKLRILNITYCDKGITDDAMRHVAKCRELRELKMNYVTKLTNAGMHSLSCHGRLHSVEARGCQYLGNSGVQALVELCRDLRLLDISGCELVSTPAMEACAAMVAERPHVLTVIVGGTAVERSDAATDSKGKLKIDYSDYSWEGHRSGDIHLEADDYYDGDLHDDAAEYYYVDSSDYEGDADDYYYLDPSDYEDDKLMVDSLIAGAVSGMNSADFDNNDDFWNDYLPEENLIAEENAISDEIPFQENEIVDEIAFQENAIVEGNAIMEEILFQENEVESDIAFQENAIAEELAFDQENAYAEEYESSDRLAFKEFLQEDEYDLW
nr:F-box/LRR-repeat protein 2-like isoform X2 [Rhipicephalus microplus]